MFGVTIFFYVLIAVLAASCVLSVMGYIQDRKILKGLNELNDEGSRGFTLLSDNAIEPTRGTSKAAGYDLYAAHDLTIKPGALGKDALVKTDVAAYMEDDEVFILKGRSGLGYKQGVLIGAGVIDADYYYNMETDEYGNIGVVIHNWTSEDIVVKKGDRIAQGIFTIYLTADGDNAGGDRSGGFGSTGK
jgi:dUTP pyrophosphatase